LCPGVQNRAYSYMTRRVHAIPRVCARTGAEDYLARYRFRTQPAFTTIPDCPNKASTRRRCARIQAGRDHRLHVAYAPNQGYALMTARRATFLRIGRKPLCRSGLARSSYPDSRASSAAPGGARRTDSSPTVRGFWNDMKSRVFDTPTRRCRWHGHGSGRRFAPGAATMSSCPTV